MIADNFSYIVSILTLLSQLFIIVVALQLLSARKGKELKDPARFLGQNAILMGFLAALGATLGSIFYSNVLGYEPCLLCWYQRIFTWPQTIIFGLALLKKKDQSVMDYALVLSSIGALIAVYHIYIELGGADIVGCGAYEGAVSCSRRYVSEFGFVTLPVMSLSVYFGIIVTMLSARKVRK